jgi:prophage regulatory protein
VTTNPASSPRKVTASSEPHDRLAALDQILGTHDIEQITGKHRCTIYRWIQDKRFPRKHSFRGREIGWRRSDIEQWLAGDRNQVD